MTNSLQGKTAIVTGGTAGIGRAIVEAMSGAGAKLIFTGTNQQAGEAVSAATGAIFVKFDATAPGYIEEIAKALDGLGGALNILVNNAGGAGGSVGVEKTTEAEFNAAMALNLWSPWQLMSTFAPRMAENGGGAIVNIGSIVGQRVGASSATYAVSKAGLLHLTRYAAAEFGPVGVRVNSVSPGFVETGIHAKTLRGDDLRKQKFTEGIGRQFLNRQPLKHLGQPKDVTEIVMFLVSDAAAFVTGTDIVADGGLSWSRSG
jgi:NAD(P)-dependent dehydrogenase (short-subunit alcohol dehydrogenase family)